MLLGFTLAPVDGFDQILQQVTCAEAASFDFVWLSEGVTLSSKDADGRIPFEATLLASALATQTYRIGLLVTAAPARHEPYNLARRLASLDWISKGRIGWMADAGADTEREDEYVGLVGNLWDSWDDDAFIYDKPSSRFFTPEKMHVLNHEGRHFSVRGPLNVNRPPQGRPPIAALADTPLSAKAELILVREDASGFSPALRSGRAGKSRFLAGWSDFEGTAAVLADRLQHERDKMGLDGFVLAPSSPTQLLSFIDDVVPELTRRGLIGGAQPASTLRDRFNLPRPALPAKLEVSA